jgi:murein DD-endopeptidase MepM/ murein hydrolase activator NlpD
MMKNLYLIKYRLKNNDIEIKIVSILLITIFCASMVCFFKPFDKLKEILANKDIEILAYNVIDIDESNSDTSLTTDVILPIAGTITSSYGTRNDPISNTYSKHTGIDICGIHHDNVRAIDDGIVTFSGVQNGYGNCIEIKHSTYYSFYAHLSKINVTVNSKITKGDIIGIEGGDPSSDPNPGYSTGHHLHFEIRTNSGYGNDINPINYINQYL